MAPWWRIRGGPALFSPVAELQQAWQPEVDLKELSMGMTNDYRVAIQEGDHDPSEAPCLNKYNGQVIVIIFTG